ncbi:MAG: hypothetical protein KF816_01770 [Melioribacteraceae bacterium]|jgi:tetratricopeptide (TPR) repeat protein|nr:hypothetical protein [Melioribacteraceae bacterium]
MHEVMEKYSNAITSEMMQSNMLKLAKEHFGIAVRSEYDSINSIKESIRFFGLDLPQDIKEIFIPFAEAPIFWIYESTILTQIEDFLKFNMVRGSFNEIHRSVKENYSRWVTTKLKSEKDYYATTTINFIERDINKHNFFKLILKGIIFTYQSTFYSPLKAQEQFNLALEIVDTIRISEVIKNEIKYIIQLYIGFNYLKEQNYELANESFKNALDIKPHGSTAKFYHALTEINLGHEESTYYLLREIFSQDLNHLNLALKTNNAGMFSYFYRNAIFYNVFMEREFYKAYSIISQILEEFKIHDPKTLIDCKEAIDKLKHKKFTDFQTEEIKKSISFLEKTVQTYSGAENTLLFSIFIEFKAKLHLIIENLIAVIKQNYYSEVSDKLRGYDKRIAENLDAEKRLITELENYKVRSKEQLNESLKIIQENYDQEIIVLENRIEDLPNVDRFNPRASMSSNMMVNTIIAFIVFFIGGVAGYSNKMVHEVSEFNSIFTFVLLSGSKWGIISFIIGLFISMIISGIVVLDRFDEKQKILKRINYIKLERERALKEHKEASAHKDKIMTDNFNNSIALHKHNVADLTHQRSQIEKNLIQEADASMKPIIDELTNLTKDNG